MLSSLQTLNQIPKLKSILSKSRNVYLGCYIEFCWILPGLIYYLLCLSGSEPKQMIIGSDTRAWHTWTRGKTFPHPLHWAGNQEFVKILFYVKSEYNPRYARVCLNAVSEFTLVVETHVIGPRGSRVLWFVTREHVENACGNV